MNRSDANAHDELIPVPLTLQGGGVRLAADRWGDSSAPAVLFLHGGGQTRRSWDEAARAVSRRGWQALTVDHRGHGESDWPVEALYGWEHFADDIAALVAGFDSPPVVVGASLGGIAALLAQRRTESQLYSALILVDVTPTMDPEGVKRIVGFMGAHPEGFASLEEASAVISEYTGRPRPASTDGLRQVLRHRDGRWRWHWDVRFLHGRDRPTAEREQLLRRLMLEGASRVRVPTLVIRGTQSELVSPEAVQEFLEAVPGARYVDVQDAAHMVAGDQNDRFVEAVTGFLDGLGTPPNGRPREDEERKPL